MAGGGMGHRILPGLLMLWHGRAGIALWAPSKELELISRERIPKEQIPRVWIPRGFSTLGSPCPPQLLPWGTLTASPLSFAPSPPALGRAASSPGPAQPARLLYWGALGMSGASMLHWKLPSSAAPPRRG